MRPVKNNILVKPCELENVTAGGIIIPESIKGVSNKVKIIAVGNGTKDKEMKLKPGMIGYRVKDWGTEIHIDGELHYLMGQDAILATN